jgi:O-methyltransferase involved in polyketide biosynthesis
MNINIGTQIHKLKLEPTAALVMKWAMKLYTNNEIVLQFMNQLDLSSGEDLFAKCDAICNWYEEVILNRKHCIKQLIERQLVATECEYQLVFLAAGKSPLAIEVLMKNYSKVHLIFEIDISGMDEKKKLYDEVCPNFSNKLKCITADISTNIVTMLDKLEIGYRNDISTIILFEGISYYLQKIEMKKIMTSCQSNNKKKNIIIIEYMVPCKYVDKKRRYIPKEIFRIIKDHTGIYEISCYTKDELQVYFNEGAGDMLECYSMVDMEFARIGTNSYFKKANDGWKEIVVGKI